MQPHAPYDRIGALYDTTRRADPYLAAQLQRALDPEPGGRYLDVGCGTGNYTVALARAGLHMTGIDLSSEMIAAARNKSADVDWHVGDVHALPFADGSFDGAVCTLATHHFANVALALTEIHRVLRGGRLVILTATREQMRSYWLNAYFPRAMQRSTEQLHDFAFFEQSLRDAGFHSIRTQIYEVRDDLQDLFLHSGKHKPELYLDPQIRRGISTFSHFGEASEIEEGCRRLAEDLATGRFAAVKQSYENDRGDYLFVVAHV